MKRLQELATAERLVDDPDYERKPVAWVIHLRDKDGLHKVQDNRQKSSRRNGTSAILGRMELVPYQRARTLNDYPFFLVDKAEYVLGFDPAGKRSAEKLKLRANLFRDAIDICAISLNNVAVNAVAQFLLTFPDECDLESWECMKRAVLPSDLFAFAWQGALVHLDPNVRSYWKQLRATESNAVSRFNCLVTGAPLPKPSPFSLIKNLPGGIRSGVGLVSHNSSAFESYGLRGRENAATSRLIAEGSTTALNRLLSANPIDGRGNELSQRCVDVTKDTVLVYWSPSECSKNAVDAIGALIGAERSADPGKFRAAWDGVNCQIDDHSPFFAMTISGSEGRAIIRTWLETTVTEALNNLVSHFDDLRIVRNTDLSKGQLRHPVIPLRVMMDSLTPECGEIPTAAVAEFVHAALAGTVYPRSIAHASLLRERAEPGYPELIESIRRDARASLIKAVYNRRLRLTSSLGGLRPAPEEFDPSIDHAGYVLGTLMAAIARLHTVSTGTMESAVESVFGAASAAPKIVFPRLMARSKFDACRTYPTDSFMPLQVRLKGVVDIIADPFCRPTANFPQRLEWEQQLLFILGYHHMMNWLWLSSAQRREWECRHPDSPLRWFNAQGE